MSLAPSSSPDSDISDALAEPWPAKVVTPLRTGTPRRTTADSRRRLHSHRSCPAHYTQRIEKFFTLVKHRQSASTDCRKLVETHTPQVRSCSPLHLHPDDEDDTLDFYAQISPDASPCPKRREPKFLPLAPKRALDETADDNVPDSAPPCAQKWTSPNTLADSSSDFHGTGKRLPPLLSLSHFRGPPALFDTVSPTSQELDQAIDEITKAHAAAWPPRPKRTASSCGLGSSAFLDSQLNVDDCGIEIFAPRGCVLPGNTRASEQNTTPTEQSVIIALQAALGSESAGETEDESLVSSNNEETDHSQATPLLSSDHGEHNETIKTCATSELHQIPHQELKTEDCETQPLSPKLVCSDTENVEPPQNSSTSKKQAKTSKQQTDESENVVELSEKKDFVPSRPLSVQIKSTPHAASLLRIGLSRSHRPVRRSLHAYLYQ